MKRNNKNSKYGYEQQQIRMQETAHEMELVIDTFHNTLEVLEEYVGKLNYYPNWDSRRQLYRKKIANSDYTLEGFEDMFLTQLFIVKASVVNKPEFFLKEVQKVFHKWINASKIDANNCPDRLRHFLFEINEVLEGRGENIVNQTRELVKNRELTTDEALGFFGKLQGPINKNRERGNLLEGKNWNEAENKNEIGGDFEKGKNSFSKISQGLSSKHAGFDLFSEQKKLRGIQITSIHLTNLNEVIQEVKTNPKNYWTLDEIPTEIDNFGKTKKQEWFLIRWDARLDDYDHEGKLNFNNNPIYRWESFNAYQRFEIKKALGISVDYLTDEEIKWIVKEVKNNPSIWKIGIDKEQTYLIHSSAQGKDKVEFGTLIHDQQKFTKSEWLEIDEALVNNQYQTTLGKLKGEIPFEQQETKETLEIWAKELEKKLLILDIKKNIDKLEIREKEVIALEQGGKAREGTVLVLKGVKLNGSDYDQDTGELINKSGKVYRQDYFDDREQAEINEAFTSYNENKQIIELVKSNVKDWKSEKIGGNYWLVNNQAQKVQKEVGHLLHPKQQFTSEEWTEIESCLSSSQSIVSQVVSTVSNALPNFGNRQNYKLGVNTNEVSQPQKDDKGIGKGGIIAIGVVCAVAIAGIAVARKKLNKKVKK